MTLRPSRSAARGTTLIEAMISMSVLLVGLLGYASLLPVLSRSNHFAKRISYGSALVTDLAQNMERWQYNDPRLVPLTTVSSLSDPAIGGADGGTGNRWNMGLNAVATNPAQFSDLAGDSNATNPGAINLGTPYLGLSNDVDADGTPDFTRYWNVFAYQPPGSTAPSGLYVQIIVRWKERTNGYRQVTGMAFKPNPAAITQ